MSASVAYVQDVRNRVLALRPGYYGDFLTVLSVLVPAGENMPSSVAAEQSVEIPTAEN
jgi:hypothetical protein